MKSGKVDTFGKFVAEIIKKEQLIKGLFDFLDLAKENNINISNKIVFIGEYQNLLFEHIVLDISYVLLDKMDDKSRMQIEIEKVQDKLHNDIKNGKADINYTVEQKEKTLNELKSITKSKDYIHAIKAVTTVRDKYIAHKDFDFKEPSLLYKQLQLVVKNIRRCYEIRQLVLNNVGEVRIISPGDYDHRNIIEALLLQQEIKLLRKSGDYDMRLWEIEKRFYKDNLDFWHSEIKPQMIARGIVNE